MNEQHLNFEDSERYKRNILLETGIEGQLKLLKSSVCVIGSGGLGSPNLLYLAAAGIGNIGIIDFDVVELSNLNRQIIHNTNDLGREKIISASEKIKLLNPKVKIDTFNIKMDCSNIRNIIKNYDFIIEATDNFEAKFVINDGCVLEKKPFSTAGVMEFIGQTMSVIPYQTGCFRCIFDSYSNKNDGKVWGILGSVAGTIGTIQVTEAIKYLMGYGELLFNRLLTYNAKTMEFRKIEIERNPECPICSRAFSPSV